MPRVAVRTVVSRLRPLVGTVWLRSVGLWSCAYGVLVVSGRRFSTELLDMGWQFPIREQLAARPIATVASTTVQPPLWNLIIGVVLRWSPLPAALSLQLLMFAVGATVVVLSSRILSKIGVPPRICIVVGVAVGLDPNLVGNLFTAAYELPTAALLLALAHSFPSERGTATRGSLYAVTAIGTALVMVRSLYHPVLLVVLLAVAFHLHRHSVVTRRRVVCLAVPLVLVAALFVRNDSITGTPSWTSWEGMNLLRSVQQTIPSDDLDRAYAEGKVSGVALVEAFASYDQYEPIVGACDETGDGVLAQPYGPSVRSAYLGRMVTVPNFNSRCYLSVFDLARQDALRLIREHPDRWFVGRLAGLRTWFSSYPLRDTMGRLAAVGSVDSLRLGSTGWNGFRHPFLLDQPISLPQLALFSALMWFAFAALRRRRRGDRRAVDVLVLLTSALYLSTVAVAVVFELGEQSRFRWPVEPLVVVALVAAVAQRRAASAPGTETADRSTEGKDSA